MTLEPLLNAGSLTQLHAFAGMTAVALGVIAFCVAGIIFAHWL